MPLRLIPHVHRATHRIGLFVGRLRDPDVTQGEAHILAHLAAAGAATVSALHRAFAHQRSTLTSILDRLEARGFVARAPDARDRRSVLVSLTPRGRPLARGVAARLERLEAAALRGVPARELRLVQAVLEALEHAAAASVSGGRWDARRAGPPRRPGRLQAHSMATPVRARRAERR